MARAKSAEGTTRLTYANGVTVSVASDKAERRVASGNFSAAKPAAAKPTTSKS